MASAQRGGGKGAMAAGPRRPGGAEVAAGGGRRAEGNLPDNGSQGKAFCVP